MSRVYFYFFLVVLLGCLLKKDQVENLENQPTTSAYSGKAANKTALYITCAPCHGDAAQEIRKMNGPTLPIANDWSLPSTAQPATK
jgi:hypothetical protein